MNDTENVLEMKVFNIGDWTLITDLLSMTRAGIDSEFLVLKANSLKSGKTYLTRITGRSLRKTTTVLI